jgi:PKHD-type hydroxylase
MAWFLEANSITERWAYTDAVFNAEECSDLIKLALDSDSKTQAKTGTDPILNNVRKGSVVWLDEKKEENFWVYRRCTDIISNLNKKYFNYDLTFIETLQFTIYDDTNDYYGMHVDNMYRGYGCRKLSFSVQLSSEENYSGCELKLYYDNKPVTAPKNLGMLIAFSSMVLHEVTPITKGTRYSLVGWVHGPKFK